MNENEARAAHPTAPAARVRLSDGDIDCALYKMENLDIEICLRIGNARDYYTDSKDPEKITEFLLLDAVAELDALRDRAEKLYVVCCAVRSELKMRIKAEHEKTEVNISQVIKGLLANADKLDDKDQAGAGE
ncbi:hypothetical protein ACRQD2_08760 [Actinotignum sp. GS-2025e]|uniref:hypothetical protein n=1 Tax=Actinotignum TaxID=1653174 RepID=UPI00254FAD68|nr:hypothetical protein [Actinotignum timonense]MDK8283143.1 hypothetical protein [Actinotignum timonense]